MICLRNSEVETALAVETSTCLHLEMVVKQNTAYKIMAEVLGIHCSLSRNISIPRCGASAATEKPSVDVEAALATHHVIVKSNQIERVQTMLLWCKIRGVHVLATGQGRQESKTIVFKPVDMAMKLPPCNTSDIFNILKQKLTSIINKTCTAM